MKKDFKDMVVYQIYPKSFQDTNGDGFGDLNGIRKRLGQLNKLGVDMIWITPFFKSHQHDNGYDVDDYKSIDPRYGDFDDFNKLVKEADELGMGIMLDMVFNHSSIYHSWFQEALKGNPKYMDYYIFKDPVEGKAPTNWVSKFGGPAWEYVEDLDKYYLHLFHRAQADLNWENEDLRNELVDIIKFWKDKGVKGFRFDVINLISKPEIYEDDLIGDGRRFYTDGPKVHDYIKELSKKAKLEEVLTVGEMSSTSIDNCILYTNPKEKELDMTFSFHHLKVDYKDGKKWDLDKVRWHELKEIFDDWQLGMQESNGWSAWFFNNHDQPRAISRFGDDENYHYETASMLANITHLLRGTPYIYQGEEIGMTDPNFTSIDQYRDVESLNYYEILREEGKTNEEALYILSKRSRDNSRTPLAWDSSKNAGFTSGKPWLELNDFSKINYEKALEDKNSIFYHYQKLIRLRKTNPLVSRGFYKPVKTPDKIYAFERFIDDKSLIVINNFSGKKIENTMDDKLKQKYRNSNILLNNYPCFDIDSLEPYQSLVIEN